MYPSGETMDVKLAARIDPRIDPISILVPRSNTPDCRLMALSNAARLSLSKSYAEIAS